MAGIEFRTGNEFSVDGRRDIGHVLFLSMRLFLGSMRDWTRLICVGVRERRTTYSRGPLLQQIIDAGVTLAR